MTIHTDKVLNPGNGISAPIVPWQPRCLKPEAWPLIDRQLWQSARTPAGYLEDGGAAALLAPDSCAKYRKGYGVWLSFLMDNGWLDPTVHPADRITRRRLAAYFQAMRDRNRRAYSINGRFQELRGMMRAIAPDHDTAWISRPNGMTIRRMLRPSLRAVIVPDSGVLFQWAIEMMETANLDIPRLQDLIAFRDGLLLAMLAARAAAALDEPAARRSRNPKCRRAISDRATAASGQKQKI